MKRQASLRARYDVALDPRGIQPVIDVAARYSVTSKTFNAREMIA